MTVQDVISGFHEKAEHDEKRSEYANELFQEAIRISIELNTKYHTPEEVREIMAQLTGKIVDNSFRLWGKMCLLIRAVIFKIRVVLPLEMAA